VTDRQLTRAIARLLLFSLLLGVVQTNLPAVPISEFIFENAPFQSAHASTLVELANGDLLAAWFGGTAEGKPDVAIWHSRRAQGHWSAPSVLVREPQIACYNPVLFHTRDGRLWLYYKFGPSPDEWTAGRRWSDDEGTTWSPVEHLPAGLYGPIRAKPLVLPDGVVVSGTSVESYGSWAAWIERSTDNAKTWTRIGPISLHTPAPQAPGDYGIIQPTVIDLGNDHLRLYSRSTLQIGRICVADSNDGGSTWANARPLDVPNPNSGIDVVRLKDGRFVLAYNNTRSGRTPLNLGISEDGEHFQSFRILENGPGEFSYPALIVARNGDLLLTYTWKRQKIRFVQIPAAEIPK
jgi:predicted neuraminidase